LHTGSRAESREQRAESREQRAESREQRAESREQRAEVSDLGRGEGFGEEEVHPTLQSIRFILRVKTMFKGVTKVLQWSYNGVTRVLQ
jgi:hypothetical protein